MNLTIKIATDTVCPSPYMEYSHAFSEKTNILIAGDTCATVESLRAHFFQKTCEVETAYTSEEIRKKLAGSFFDVLICGFLLNDDYALRIAEIVRRASNVRMLFLTGKNDPMFNAKVLNLGADDCLTSSASLFELDARVLRLCNRNMRLRFRETKILLGQIEIDMITQAVKKNGNLVSMTKSEYRILLHLALNVGRMVPRAKLSHHQDETFGHSLNTHILNLRKKFKTALSIKTVSCYGFLLEA